METVLEGERHREEDPEPVLFIASTPPPPPTATRWPCYGREDESNSPAYRTQTALQQRKQNDTCFNCGQQGHWAQFCPSRTSTPDKDIHQLPVLRCHCGVAYSIRVSHTAANPGKRFNSRNCTCEDEGKRHSEQDPGPVLIIASTPPPTATRWPCSGREDESNSPTHRTQTALQQRMQNDTCFNCGQQGHWAQFCPSKTYTPDKDIHQLPVLRCHCGVAYSIRVSHTAANPGKRFYSRNCSCEDEKATQGQDNPYKKFTWSDNVKAPMCPCGAGACAINIQKTKDEKDVIYTVYYTCRIKTGHGACGFLDLVTPPNSPNLWTVPRSVEKDKQPSELSPMHCEPLNIITHENECSSTSFSNRNTVVREADTCNLVMRKGHDPSRLMSPSDIHLRQIEFWNQISAADDSANKCKVLPILGLRVHGWVGRLAFPPPRFLADPPPSHFFCCIFPLFDPILVSEYVDISNSGSSRIMPHVSSNDKVDRGTQNALRNYIQLLDVPSRTSSLKRSFTTMKEDVTSSTLKGVGKKHQKGLLTRSMEPIDHDTILQAPNATFDASACLLIGQGPLAEHVMQIIQPASLDAAQTEMTVQDSCNLEAPMEMTVQAFKDMLLQIENQAQQRETVTSKLETFLQDMITVAGQAKRIMQASYEAVKKVLNLLAREDEQSMARTIPEEACSSSSESCRLYLRKRRKIKGNHVNEAE